MRRIDEAYIGGKEGKHKDKKFNGGRGPVGKAPVVGLRNREGKKVEENNQ